MGLRPGGETQLAMRDVERRIREELARIEKWRESMALIKAPPKPAATELDVLAFLASVVGPNKERKAKHTNLAHWVTNDGYMVSAKQFPKKMILMRGAKGHGANLIMRLFGPRPPSEWAVVHHKDFDKRNNHIDNLEWRSLLEVNEMRKKLNRGLK